MKKRFIDYAFHCHKLPDRSFFYKGKQFPLCSRCTGTFLGYILGLIFLISGIFFPKFILKFYISLIFIIPMAIDGLIQLYTSYESNNLKRFVTGTFGGIGIIYFLYYVAITGMANGRWLVEHIFR